MAETPPEKRQFPEGYKETFFETLKRDTRYFNRDDYQKIYAPVKEHFGIDSPACIIAKHVFPQHPFPELLPLDIQGSYLIAIDIDSVPDKDFLRYLEHHEHWEIYIAEKEGFNLRKFCLADPQRPILERERKAHQFATYKEFQESEKDGKLDQYLEWWKTFYEASIREIESLSSEEVTRISKNYGLNGGNKDMIVNFLRKGLEIKEKAYQKIVSRRKS